MDAREVKALRERAVELAREHRPIREAQEDLNEMLLSFDLPPSEEMPEQLARRLFESWEMGEYLQSLTMLYGPRPKATSTDSLESLRSALLL